jgi:hypothetical protein
VASAGQLYQALYYEHTGDAFITLYGKTTDEAKEALVRYQAPLVELDPVGGGKRQRWYGLDSAGNVNTLTRDTFLSKLASLKRDRGN